MGSTIIISKGATRLSRGRLAREFAGFEVLTPVVMKMGYV
jgi:hypothetical protein